MGQNLESFTLKYLLRFTDWTFLILKKKKKEKKRKTKPQMVPKLKLFFGGGGGIKSGFSFRFQKYGDLEISWCSILLRFIKKYPPAKKNQKDPILKAWPSSSDAIAGVFRNIRMWGLCKGGRSLWSCQTSLVCLWLLTTVRPVALPDAPITVMLYPTTSRHNGAKDSE